MRSGLTSCQCGIDKWLAQLDDHGPDGRVRVCIATWCGLGAIDAWCVALTKLSGHEAGRFSRWHSDVDEHFDIEIRGPQHCITFSWHQRLAGAVWAGLNVHLVQKPPLVASLPDHVDTVLTQMTIYDNLWLITSNLYLTSYWSTSGSDHQSLEPIDALCPCAWALGLRPRTQKFGAREKIFAFLSWHLWTSWILRMFSIVFLRVLSYIDVEEYSVSLDFLTTCKPYSFSSALLCPDILQPFLNEALSLPSNRARQGAPAPFFRRRCD